MGQEKRPRVPPVFRKKRKKPFRTIALKWWGKVDSNHRSLRQQIYSLPPLASREFPHYGAGDGTRTRNLLITNQLLCRLSYTSIFW